LLASTGKTDEQLLTFGTAYLRRRPNEREAAAHPQERTARPGVETYRAVLPSLMTLPGAMLVGISTPHKKSGLLFERYNERRRHGV
jgi:hypothetical protein